MAVISKGQTFATGDQVTASKLNNLADNATFASGAVDNVSTQLSGGAIVVKDGGVTTTKIADSAVTLGKIQDISAGYVLGRAHEQGEGSPEEIFIDNNLSVVSTSHNSVASAKAIKDYVDASSTSGFSPSSYTGGESVTLPNGLIMKFGSSTVGSNSTKDITFGTAFTSVISAQLTILNDSTTADFYALRISSLSSSVLSVVNSNIFAAPFYWMVIGR